MALAFIITVMQNILMSTLAGFTLDIYDGFHKSILAGLYDSEQR